MLRPRGDGLMNGASTVYRRWAAMGREGGFTLIELLVVVVLVGITSAMFATTLGAFVNRSTDVQTRTSSRPRCAPLSTSSSATFVMRPTETPPFRSSATHPVRSPSIHPTVWATCARSVLGRRHSADWYMYRQVTTSTNTGGPPWTGISSDPGPIETLFDSIRIPPASFSTAPRLRATWRSLRQTRLLPS